MKGLDFTAAGNSPRCAIYTRKSFQPPLAQEITSLESQRSICSSYIASQQHKGWIELAKRYEDSGRSGATLDRPALNELISDIENGLVEIVIVYKLDRMSRTLLDFVRLMDFFERYGVLFVAITQNFDTSDSMGRLIRNVLLTFAQFEREIASDRMRDKRMVMRQNGLWIGGDAPLGYDSRCGKLVPNGFEAPAVRCIFETYVATGRVVVVHEKLLALGYRRKVWKTNRGTVRGGGPIALSSLHHILRNPVYIGEVAYGGERSPAIHQPIVDRELWNAAQVILKEREQLKPRRAEHLLTGILFDSHGRRMYARYFSGGGGKGKARVGYYESPVKTGVLGESIRRTRAKADQLESITLEALKSLLVDRARIRPILMQANIFGSTLEDLCRFSPAAAARLERLTVPILSGALKALLTRVEVAEDCVRLLVRAYALAKFIGWDGVGYFKLGELELARATRLHVIVLPVAVARRRRVSWLPLERRASSARPNYRLVKLIREARSAQELLLSERTKPIRDIARGLGRRMASFSRLVRLNYLAPDILAAIVDGTQPATLTRRKLIECDLPTDWGLQRRLLGFPAKEELAVLHGDGAAAASPANQSAVRTLTGPSTINLSTGNASSSATE
jgi:DNA invertase Pin-like site-specific DNA recombinase